MDMYPPLTGYPLCTLENIPRLPEHCVAYVKVKVWETEKPFGEEKNDEGKSVPVPIDGDNPAHITWIMQKAEERRAKFGLHGSIDFAFTQGVVKSIIPVVGLTNAFVAAQCVHEAIKLLTAIGPKMNNYNIFQCSQGTTSGVTELWHNPDCEVCRPPDQLRVPANFTFQQLHESFYNNTKISREEERIVGKEKVKERRMMVKGVSQPDSVQMFLQIPGGASIYGMYVGPLAGHGCPGEVIRDVALQWLRGERRSMAMGGSLLEGIENPVEMLSSLMLVVEGGFLKGLPSQRYILIFE
jgi:hypothetical protein